MRYLSLICVLALAAACGFQPLHSRAYREQQSIDLSSLMVTVDNSRHGQLLEAEISDAINPDYQRAAKLYHLAIAVKENDVPLFIKPDGTSARGDIQLTSTFRLTRLADNALVNSGTIHRVSSYNTSDQAAEGYASFVSVADAKKRAVLELAQDYKLRMANVLSKLSARE